MLNSSSSIESFLYQSEGTALDFKKEQYSFIGATDEHKSELLKDILAFANSWRQGDAYIVIGVEAVVGGRHIPVGTEEHFDDAQLQQFVNSKTNRKVTLSYEVHLFEGKKIGLLKLAKQERPIYAKERFGKVLKEAVYYRLGSSTAIATPEDIARMGRDSVNNESAPVMSLQFVDCETRQELGTFIELFSLTYKQSLKSLPNAVEQQCSGFGTFVAPTNRINANYWREKEEYVRLTNLVNPVSLALCNLSGVLAERVRVEIVGSSSSGITIMRIPPREPAYRHNDEIVRHVSAIRPAWQKDPQVGITHHGEQWTLTVNFGSVQPKSYVWLEEPFYIGSNREEYFEMEAVIYADNLPEPQKVALTIKFQVERRPALTVDILKTLPPFEK